MLVIGVNYYNANMGDKVTTHTDYCLDFDDTLVCIIDMYRHDTRYEVQHMNRKNGVTRIILGKCHECMVYAQLQGVYQGMTLYGRMVE